MFAPTKIWRRWHRRVNIAQKRYAVCSALAASGVPALVMARGHAIMGINEVPLVVSDNIQTFTKTEEAVTFLRKTKAWEDVARVYATKRMRAGKGKMRNRRRIQKLGPLVIFDQDQGLTRAFRNIPGVETMQVDTLNILRLAPGGHLGRFIIWTEGAFKKLDGLYGTWKEKSTQKVGWNLPMPKMANTDLTKLLRSEEIRKVLRPANRSIVKAKHNKANPLKNYKAMLQLNPYAAVLKKQAQMENANNILKKSSKRDKLA